MTSDQAVDRIETVLHDFKEDYYDIHTDDDPLVDIAEIIDHYRNHKQ